MNITKAKGESRVNRQPNVLFIMTDQQRWDTLGCHGNRAISTPHLDRMAEEGADFDHFYVNNPLCVPSRCSYLTGRYPNAHRSRDLEYGLDDGETHFFQMFQDAGYYTGLIGKNHVLGKEALGRFDQVLTKRHQKTDIPRTGKLYESFVDPVPAERYTTSVIGQEAESFIEEAGSAGRPFCLWVSFPDPHTPFQVPEPYASSAAKALIPAPVERIMDRSKPPSQRALYHIQGLEHAAEEEIVQLRSIYYGMVKFIDEAVGGLMKKIQESGLDEDTIVIFTSDHGEYLGDHGLVRKSCNFYDCLLNVPFLIRWKNRIQPRRIAGTMAESVDLLPTLMELVGFELPEGVQGKSMASLLLGRQDKHKEAVFAEVGSPGEDRPDARIRPASHKPPAEAVWKATAVQGSMIRTMDWKLCLYGNGEGELYDLDHDPDEVHNKFGVAPYMEQELAMTRRLVHAMMSSQDPRKSGGDRMGAGNG